MSKRMKIVLVTPLLDNGGGQRFITELANYWDALNYDVSIILLRSGESFYPISKNIKIYELGYSNVDKQGKFDKLRSTIRTLYKLRKKIKQIQPKFVLSILSSTNILTIATTRNLKTKVYVNDIMSPYRKRTSFEKKCRKLLYKRADGVIALTNIAKEIIYKETKSENIAVIPNPVKEVNILENIKKEKIILNVGRLVHDKGQKYLLEAYAKLNKLDWKVVILGEGDRRDSLKELANKLNINNQVLMPGAVKNVDEWLSKASIFAFPSVSESWGLALTESMVAGLPSVSFDCEVGPREMIVDGENGFLVPVGDVDLFTKRIEQLIDDEDLREKFSVNAKKEAEKYKIEIIGNRILEFCTNS